MVKAIPSFEDVGVNVRAVLRKTLKGDPFVSFALLVFIISSSLMVGA